MVKAIKGADIVVTRMFPSVRSNTALLTLSLVGQKILAFIYFALIARIAGVHITGRYASALAFTTLISILADAGLTPVVIREVAKDKSRAAVIFGSLVRVKVALAVLTVATIITAAHLVGFSAEARIFIYLASMVVIFDATSVTLFGVLRGYQNLWYESWGMFFGQVGVLVAGGAVLLLQLHPALLVLALAFGGGFNVLYALRVLRRLGFAFRAAYDRTLRNSLIAAAVPFALAGIFTRVYAQIDTVLIARMLGEHAAGIYSIPQKVGFAFQFFPIALAAALYPALTKSIAQNSARAALLFERALIYLAALSLPITALIFALAPQIVHGVFGSAYGAAILPLQIVIVSIVFGFLDYPFGSLLNAAHKQSLQTLSMGITMVVNVALNVALIPRIGVLGASVAALISQIVLVVSGAIFARGLIPWRIRHIFFPLAGATAGALGAALVAYTLRGHMHFAVAGALGGVVYVVLALSLRVIPLGAARALLRELAHMRARTEDPTALDT